MEAYDAGDVAKRAEILEGHPGYADRLWRSVITIVRWTRLSCVRP